MKGVKKPVNKRVHFKLNGKLTSQDSVLPKINIIEEKREEVLRKESSMSVLTFSPQNTQPLIFKNRPIFQKKG
jgi:hypothetical protein